ncbi:MAG: FAD-dependent oxidoreductase [Lysobacterales bacterium]
MDLKSGYPFWSVKNGLLHEFPPLARDHTCDVAIVGGGITGALIAHELAQHGHDVCVLEQRDVAWGSTSASTALLQYEIDEHMVDLAKRYGEADAVLAYRACASAIPMIAKVSKTVRDVDFAPMQSLYFASKQGHVKDLREEFALRAKHGFQVEWIEQAALAARFGIEAPVAILSRQAARVDPYRLASKLFAKLERNGGHVFDRTRVARIEPGSRSVKLVTDQNCVVRARHVVLAGGYETQSWLDQRVAKNRSSYACISDPIDSEALGVYSDLMVWESARPYLYFRATGDGRLVVGGEDDALDVPAKRDAQVGRKSEKLAIRVRELLPQLPMEPVFAWAGTFAETDDGLPFFGPHEQHGPRVHFAMAYGGNGITYSALGAGLLRANIERRPHPLRELFSFERLKRGSLLVRLGF